MFLYSERQTPDREAVSPRLIVLPAFTTNGHAVAFVGFLIALLIAPALLERIWPADSVHVYKGIPLSYVNYHHIGETIAEGGVIDVVVIGASDAWTALDVRVLREGLSKHLGRPARVVNLSTNWAGEDRHHQVLSDL